MVKIYHPLLTLIASSTESELAKYVEYLKEENLVLSGRVQKSLYGESVTLLETSSVDRNSLAKGIACQGQSPIFNRSFPRSSLSRPGRSFVVGRLKGGSGNGLGLLSCWTRIPSAVMPKSDVWSDSPISRCGTGENAGVRAISRWKTSRDRGVRRRFPPGDHAEIKAAACETVRETKLPLSKQSTTDLARRMKDRIGRSISRSTVWRILSQAAIRPWQHRS